MTFGRALTYVLFSQEGLFKFTLKNPLLRIEPETSEVKGLGLLTTTTPKPPLEKKCASKCQCYELI